MFIFWTDLPLFSSIMHLLRRVFFSFEVITKLSQNGNAQAHFYLYFRKETHTRSSAHKTSCISSHYMHACTFIFQHYGAIETWCCTVENMVQCQPHVRLCDTRNFFSLWLLNYCVHHATFKEISSLLKFSTVCWVQEGRHLTPTNHMVTEMRLILKVKVQILQYFERTLSWLGNGYFTNFFDDKHMKS